MFKLKQEKWKEQGSLPLQYGIKWIKILKTSFEEQSLSSFSSLFLDATNIWKISELRELGLKFSP